MCEQPNGNPQLSGACADCGRRYGDEYGFPDLIIPDDVWVLISPRSGHGGLLCPSCICRRLAERGIKCYGYFGSGPLASEEAITVYRVLTLDDQGRRPMAIYGSLEKAKSHFQMTFFPLGRFQGPIEARLMRASLTPAQICTVMNQGAESVGWEHIETFCRDIGAWKKVGPMSVKWEIPD